MKKQLLLILSIALVSLSLNLNAQGISPDKFNDKVLKDDHSMGLRVPGWLVKKAAKWSSVDLEDDEKKMIKELAGDIKKIRVLVNTALPEKYREDYANLKTHLQNNYDNLIDVRRAKDHVNVWVKTTNDDVIKNFLVSVMSEDNELALINIKTKMPMEHLKNMNFFKELDSL